MKIGVAIITCNRSEMFQKCINSIPTQKVDEMVVVNDGDYIKDSFLNAFTSAELIETQGKGVGIAKNAAMQHLLNKNCDYIFIIEDDMLIKQEGIFDAYIAASKSTGIQHMMFAYHGPANKNNVSGGPPCPRTIIEYPSGIKISLNQHCVGAFCMYTKESLLDVGLFNTQFHNAFEHVHHSYLMCKHNFCTAYWWWPDLANSLDYIEEQACSEHNSTIRPRKDWQDNIRKGFEHFIKLEGISPVQIPDVSFDKVKNKLKQLLK
jgi:glycosyltransferase involved in cell wall biosynthesis